VNPDYVDGVNVDDQQVDPRSMLNFYRSMLAMRRVNPALIGGEFELVNADALEYLAFLRTSEEQRLLVVLNMSAEPQHVAVDLPQNELQVVFSSHDRAAIEQAAGFEIEPFEVFIAAY
jgi:alpha-glucosidase